MKKTLPFLPVLLLLLLACDPGPHATFSGTLATEGSEVRETSGLSGIFADAAETWSVPADVLKAVAYAETQIVAVQGEVEFEGQPEPWGLFALKGTELTRAAELAGYDVNRVRAEPEANIHAAAALLDDYARQEGIDDRVRPEPLQWGPAVGRFGGHDEDLRATHAAYVLDIIRAGAAVALADGTTILIGRYGTEGELAQQTQGLGHPGTIWRPSPNHNSRGAASVQFVVIHSCEGSYSGCVSWLRNSASRVSAHYVVNERGTEISQLVDENRRAWHIGARYRSSLNGGRMPHLDGLSSNTYSIGIEHAGRALQPSWDPSLIDASVDLVRGITERHDIPRDRYHIVAHGQLQPESRIDPGPNWPWVSYLSAIQDDGTTPDPTVVTVDNTTRGRFRASSPWGRSTWAAGKFGTDYRYRSPAFTSDPAEWKVELSAAGRYEVFARVPGNGYNSNAPFIVHHRGGSTTVRRDLRAFGASWMSLGTYDFDAVDDWIVQLSCWTNGQGFLIADAVRFEPR